MELVKSEIPEYEEETQYLEYSYYIENDKIYEKCEVKDIIIDEIINEDIVQLSLNETDE